MTVVKIRTVTGWHKVTLPECMESVYQGAEYGDEGSLQAMYEWTNEWAYENEGQPCEEWE